MKYRKKPVAIEAIKFTRNNIEELKEFTKGKLHNISIPRCLDGVMTGTVDTLEGQYKATENDYIIRGIQGEIYPCKPYIFEKTYEKVE